MKNKLNITRALCISYRAVTPLVGEIITKIPNTEMKKKVLDHISNPNFESYIYIDSKTDILHKSSSKVKFNNDYKFGVTTYFQIPKSIIQAPKHYDQNFLLIKGNYSRPVTFYDPIRYKKHEIVPFVIFNSDGSLIENTLQKFLESINDSVSPLTVVKIYKWEYENSSTTNYNVIPIKRRIETLLQLLEK